MIICKNYLKRIKKLLEIYEQQLNKNILRKQRPKYKWKIQNDFLSLRIIYNDKNLRIYKEKEIKLLKRY